MGQAPDVIPGTEAASHGMDADALTGPPSDEIEPEEFNRTFSFKTAAEAEAFKMGVNAVEDATFEVIRIVEQDGQYPFVVQVLDESRDEFDIEAEG